ncbi:lysylphosphatidylglycerol synthase transmembrane domain-containing protein [Granulicella aggregans]|uniref:lysylphosphatidylglycerol synthase transmembrane domain-containing protein n=1 Tax=Granulicella aggregans TaxID=474949 RepID=UPI0021E06A0B|nr:lysylphosphatidylglycerol synthase transmembrane domain-containing protein [Granulicella aggregans]
MSEVNVAAPKASASKGRNLLKTLPGLLISAGFLWYTFSKISFSDLRAVRMVAPVWVLGVLAFTLASYTLRCVRWTRMMRSTGAKFGVCARVLMTSLAANNILPLRIGDIMRVFTYAGDLGASPSVILSTVILEKLLDIFILVLLFTVTMGADASPHSKALAKTLLAISTVGLLVLIVGARTLKGPLERFFAKHSSNAKIAKLEHFIMLAIDCLVEIGIPGSVLLLVQSAIIWTCEGMIFVSAAKLIGLVSDKIGPWAAVSVANLSYLIPSSPGAIGTLDLAVTTDLELHGAVAAQAAPFALLVHAWLLISVTGAGGLIFLIHRARRPEHKPLIEEIETLPTELP